MCSKSEPINVYIIFKDGRRPWKFSWSSRHNAWICVHRRYTYGLISRSAHPIPGVARYIPGSWGRGKAPAWADMTRELGVKEIHIGDTVTLLDGSGVSRNRSARIGRFAELILDSDRSAIKGGFTYLAYAGSGEYVHAPTLDDLITASIKAGIIEEKELDT